jgi:uncharacterized protein YbjT (DUF2867 family)
MILIVGASGWLGGTVARLLLAEEKPVRVVSRMSAKVENLFKLGAEVAVGDLRQPETLRRALRGVDVVFAAAHAFPGEGENNPVTVDDAGNRALIDAAREAGVTHFVFTSMLDVRHNHPVDVLRFKYGIEQYLFRSKLSYTIIRPSFFMESWAVQIGEQVVEKGEMTIVGHGHNPINFVSVDDVARLVLMALERPEMRDRVIRFGGPENLTLHQVAAIFEQIVGRFVTKKYYSLERAKATSMLMRRVNPALSREMAMGAYLDTADLTFDPTEVLRVFPMQLKRMEGVIRQRYSSLSRIQGTGVA